MRVILLVESINSLLALISSKSGARWATIFITYSKYMHERVRKMVVVMAVAWILAVIDNLKISYSHMDWGVCWISLFL